MANINRENKLVSKEKTTAVLIFTCDDYPAPTCNTKETKEKPSTHHLTLSPSRSSYTLALIPPSVMALPPEPASKLFIPSAPFSPSSSLSGPPAV